MSLSYTHGREFVCETRPILERQDAGELVRYLERRWPNASLLEMLSCGHEDAVKTALVCLAYRGTMAELSSIARFLGDDDPVTSAVAEHAMWCIWFRSGNESADAHLTRAVQLISESHMSEAIAELDELVSAHPWFAEAYNQRGIAYFLQEDYARSADDCRRALELNPYHFGAMAGLGHCYASLGQLDQALDAYCNALQLHPKLEGIRQSIQQIRATQGLPESRPDPGPRDPAAHKRI